MKQTPRHWKRFVKEHTEFTIYRPRNYEFSKAPMWLKKEFKRWLAGDNSMLPLKCSALAEALKD